MKRLSLFLGICALSLASFAQSKGMTAQDYYQQAEVHKQRAMALEEEEKNNTEFNSAPDAQSRQRANNKSHSRREIIKQEWQKYSDLMTQAEAVAKANKQSEAQKLNELKEVLGKKDK